ncbi:MAG: FtsX-like permease family protein [Gammaproteobacteria bacterium]|nr:FtsX-like permease family protein [Gammaproteobacteria bacterium]
MQANLVWVLKAVFSHYWRHGWQTLFLLVGLIAGVGLWSGVQIINQQARLSYEQADSLLGVQASYWIRSRTDKAIEVADYISLRRAGFRQIFPVVEAQVSTEQGQPISIIATDLFALPNNLQVGDEDDTAADWLSFVQPPYRAWVPGELANELKLETGDQLLLRDGRRLPPALIKNHSQQGRQILMDIAASFELLNRETFSYLVVGNIEAGQISQLETLLPDRMELVENQQHLDLRELTESLHTHLSAMSLLSFAVGLFIVFNAVRFSLWYRRATFLSLRLMGVSASLLLSAVLIETLLWSLIGAGAGIVVGLQIGKVLLPGLGASLHSLYDATVDTQLIWQFDTLFKAWGITLLGLFWALTWPLYQQLRRNSLPANLISRVSLDERRSRHYLALSSSALIILSVILYPRIDNAISGFLLLGLILFGAAWLLPTLLAFTLRLLSGLTSKSQLVTRWLIGDGWTQLPALRTAMMALLLAMTANLGVGTLVDSFRSAFVGWLEVRQSADIYLRASQIDYERLLDPQKSSVWLADSHRRIGLTSRWQGRPALIRGVDTLAPDSLQLPLAQWSEETAESTLKVWQTEKNTLLANEQVHYLAGIRLNQTIQLKTDQGPVDYRVIGFFYDYGNPNYQFYLPYDEVVSYWKQYHPRGVALWLNNNDTITLQLAQQAMRDAGAETGDWILQNQVRKLSLNIFERTFTITAAMNALTMIVAAIALLASLLAILQERLPQFAQWRALGVRSQEQMLIIACPILIFVFVAWLLAIPLGALLSWILIHKLNIVSFGWSMPMRWDILPAIQLGGVILLVVAATLMLANWQLRRRMPNALAQLGELA